MYSLFRKIQFILLLSGLAMLGACSSTGPRWDAEMPYVPARTPQLGDILHTRSGHYLSRQQLYESLANYPLVYVGETHDNPASHRLELDILRELLASHPGQVSLGMEMFNSGQQPVLDRWVAGELSEKDFLKLSGWYQNWGMDFALYRDLLEFAREERVPVIALNAPQILAHKVSEQPLAQLDEETRQQLPEMDLQDPYQRAMVKGIFGGHAHGGAMLDSFQRRQTLWDEYMAQSVAEYVQAHPGRRMLVIAGGWHVQYGFGIPRRVHRRLPLPYVLVGGKNLVVPEQKQGQMMDVDIPDFPMRRVDYLVYQTYEVFKHRGVRLGVALEDDPDAEGVLITGVSPDSAASRAGIRKGDHVLGFDGKRVRESFDLVYAVRNHPRDRTAKIDIQRGEELLVLEARFEDDAADKGTHERE